MKSRNILVLMAAFTAALAMVIGAAGRTDGLRAHTAQECGEETEGFRLSASIKGGQFKVGEPVALKLTIKNVTEQELYLEETSPARQYKIVVKNERGEIVPLTEAGRRVANADDFMRVAIRLKPGEEREDIIEVSEFHEMTAPGAYSITASRAVKNRGGQGWSDVVSNTVSVRIDY